MDAVLEPIRKKSLATAVFEQLRDRILHGHIQPGDSLPSERILVERLQVNRGAVREGLKRLEQAGLVAITQGGATSVLDFTKTAGLEILGAMIVGPGGEINTTIARNVIEMRTSLAVQLVQRAAQQKPSDQLDSLHSILVQMENHADEIDVLQQLAMDFWRIVVVHSGSIAYQLALNSLNAVYSKIQVHLRYILADEFQALEDYTTLAKAIENQEEIKAVETTRRIVERGAQAIAGLLDELDESKNSPAPNSEEPSSEHL